MIRVFDPCYVLICIKKVFF